MLERYLVPAVHDQFDGLSCQGGSPCSSLPSPETIWINAHAVGGPLDATGNDVADPAKSASSLNHSRDQHTGSFHGIDGLGRRAFIHF